MSRNEKYYNWNEILNCKLDTAEEWIGELENNYQKIPMIKHNMQKDTKLKGKKNEGQGKEV